LDPSWWQRIEASDQSTIVRTVSIYPNPDVAQMGLVSALEKADEELEVVAELCDAAVAEHTWGLVPTDTDANRHLRPWISAHESLTPAGHALVSEVDIIKGAVCLGREHSSRLHRRAVEAGVATYYDTRRSGTQLEDMDVSQFVSGTSTTTNKEGIWLVDIEPRFST
jgi:hypothetical protein